MKTYTITKKKAGQQAKALAPLHAKDWKDAKRTFAEIIWSEFLNGEYGDDYIHENDESIEQLREEGQDVSWYEGPGIYLNKHLIFSMKEKRAGICSFTEDVNQYSLEKQ
jgi:hypothetical protein